MSGVDLDIHDLVKDYEKGGQRIRVLDGVDLSVEAGERLAIVGASGSGKSTFLHLVGMLDHPTRGRIVMDSRDVVPMASVERARLRNESVGFVFQSHNLLPEHTALNNVAMPVRLSGAPAEVAHGRAEAMLRAVGLGHRLDHQPGELSGGEQQRVSLARALVMGPGLVLADEPTGNLDPKTASGVFQLLLDLHEQLGSTLIVVTHSLQLASSFPRVLRLHHGCFVDQDPDEVMA